MKKIDSLLKKAEVFEKMALYGDRASFLKSLSQDFSDPNAPTSFPGDVKQQQDELDAKKKEIIFNVSTILDKFDLARKNVGDVAVFNRKPNMAGISQEIFNALMTGGIPALSNEYKYLSYAQKALFPSAKSDSPKETPKAAEYPHIDPKKQEALGRIVTIEGLGLPLQADGELGPKTREALKAFSKWAVIKGHLPPNATDSQLLDLALKLTKTDSKYKLREDF